MKFDVFALYLV